jgi:hypothetical protein
VSTSEIIHKATHLQYFPSASITPFGGVGPSGCTFKGVMHAVFFSVLLLLTTLDGSHKGKYSFDTFVHHRSSFNSPKWLVFYPIDSPHCVLTALHPRIDSVDGSRFPPYTVRLAAISCGTKFINYTVSVRRRSLRTLTRWCRLFLTLAPERANLPVGDDGRFFPSHLRLSLPIGNASLTSSRDPSASECLGCSCIYQPSL